MRLKEGDAKGADLKGGEGGVDAGDVDAADGGREAEAESTPPLPSSSSPPTVSPSPSPTRKRGRRKPPSKPPDGASSDRIKGGKRVGAGAAENHEIWEVEVRMTPSITCVSIYICV